MIQFSVPCIPVAQPRQRHRVLEVHGRTFAQNYTPRSHPVNAFKAAVQMAVAQAFRGPPLRGPIVLVAQFFLPRPQRLCWKKKPMPRMSHTGKPDMDNLVKSLKDAMTGLVWRDDSQICHMKVHKYICGGNERPHVEVCIEVLPDQDQEQESWQANPS